MLFPEVVEEGVDRPAASGRRDGQRLRDRGRHEFRIIDGTERHEVHAVGELVKDVGRDFEAKARLACPARPGKGQQPGSRQQLPGLADLVVAADEARQLRWQVVGGRLERLQLWELAG